MDINITFMVEDMTWSNRDCSNDEARQIVDDLDAGKHHPDAWAIFREIETGKKLEPIYGDIGTDDMQDYCIGFIYEREDIA